MQTQSTSLQTTHTHQKHTTHCKPAKPTTQQHFPLPFFPFLVPSFLSPPHRNHDGSAQPFPCCRSVEMCVCVCVCACVRVFLCCTSFLGTLQCPLALLRQSHCLPPHPTTLTIFFFFLSSLPHAVRRTCRFPAHAQGKGKSAVCLLSIESLKRVKEERKKVHATLSLPFPLLLFKEQAEGEGGGVSCSASLQSSLPPPHFCSCCPCCSCLDAVNNIISFVLNALVL